MADNNSVWIKEIDYLKGFAILAVIVIHTSTYFTYLKQLNNLVVANIFINLFSHFAVPLFIFISGFLLSHNYKSGFDLRSFYRRRVESIIPQYLIFSVLYILFFAILGTSPSLLRIIFDVFTANSSPHLWFFAILIQFYLFYPLIIKIYGSFEKKNRLYILLILSLIIQISWNILYLISKTYFSGFVFETISMRIFIGHLSYFIIGIYVNKNFDFVKKYLRNIKLYQVISFSLILTLIVSYSWIIGLMRFGDFYKIDSYYFTATVVLDPFLYLSEFIILSKISLYMLREHSIFTVILNALGRYSFGIYLIHMIFLLLMERMLKSAFNIDMGNWIFYPVIFLTTVVLSYLSIYLLSYLPQSKIIIGVHSERK